MYGQKTRFFSLALVLLLSVSYVGYIPSQGDFNQIIIPFLIASLCYIYLTFKSANSIHITWFFSLAILSRAVLLFSFPNLSDDIYRFIWDGRCLHLGISPFQYLPSEIVGKYPSLDNKLFGLLNSPNYYSIYPPVGQAIGYIATLPIISTHYSSAVIFKGFILASEIGTIYIGWKLLKRFNLPPKNIFIYALNPLVIIELMGNIHFEAFMIFFLVLSIYLLLTNRYFGSGLSIALAICSKLLPLMLLPLQMIFIKHVKKALFYALLSAFVSMSLFGIFMNLDVISNLGSSIGLYVNKFEFNASIYYLLREVGYLIKGFNTIHIVGPFLSFLTIVLICGQAIFFYIKRKSSNDLFHFILMAFCTYLFLAPIVHPWYICTPLLLCAFTTYRFPVIWSLLIVFTYFNYSGIEYYENLLIVLIEYMIVFGFLIWEVFRNKKNEISKVVI